MMRSKQAIGDDSGIAEVLKTIDVIVLAKFSGY